MLFQSERRNQFGCHESYEIFWATFMFLVGGILSWLHGFCGMRVEQSLVQMPVLVKDRIRAMIKKGLPARHAIQLVQAMNAIRSRR